MIDHAPAWDCIPWYGTDGLGAPTLADWRVWADWLMAHDPDDDRDAAIARAFEGDWSCEIIAVRCMRAYASVSRPSAAPPIPPPVMPRYVGSGFAGFEVQPTRREMRRPFADVAIAADGLPADGDAAVDWIASRAMRPGKSGYIARAVMAMVERVRAEDPLVRSLSPAPAATIEGDRWVNIPTPTNARRPRNPRRRGDTGAHGRARR